MKVSINTSLLSSGAVSLGADGVSDWFRLDNIIGFSIDAVWTGTAGSAVGNFTLQCSNDDGGASVGQPSLSTGITNTFTLGGSTIAAGSADGSGEWNVSDVFYKWVRVKYTRGSGTGSLTSCRVTAKGPA